MTAIAAVGVSPIRVLHVNSMLTGGGTDDQCVKLASGLHALGLAVRLAGPEGREFSAVVRQLGIPFDATAPEGPLKLRFIFEAARIIRRERSQIVHGHHGRDLWPTMLAAGLSGVRPKVVLTRHMAKSPRSWLTRRVLLGQCDALIAVSEFVARVLREGVYEPEAREPERRRRPPVSGNHSKVHVIHPGIDTNCFRPLGGPVTEAQRRAWELRPGDYAFAVVGGYEGPRGKGQREFLQAAARVHSVIPQARFLIVGRGNLADVLRADISRLGLTGKAWLTPYCNDMPAAMNAMDCLVHPQVGTEAFGLVVCEAHACGKPVIASALDGIPEAFGIGARGRLVPPDDIEALAGAMVEQVRTPPGSEQEDAEVRRRIVQQVSLPQVARRTEMLYRRLLSPALLAAPHDAPSSSPQRG